MDLDTETELRGRIGMLETALGVHTAGWSLAFTVFAGILADDGIVPVERVIAALDQAQESLPRAHPQRLILMGIADRLRKATGSATH